jgi:ADP-ribosylglycohydrolase
MLLELAIGDAYGAGFEFAPELVEQHNDLSRYLPHPRYATRPGTYTDDTQMSIALTEAILSGQPWTLALLAEHVVQTFQRDPHVGYASGKYTLLTQVRDGSEFLARIKPRSDRGGAAMRACPLGVFADVPTVIERCTLQAKLTHDTPDGIAAANAVALLCHYLLYNRAPKAALADVLATHLPGYPWALTWQGSVGNHGISCVRAALTAVLRHESLSQILRASVAYTGDVDTVAAIALGVAACSHEVEHDLPQQLIDGLENGAYGRDYIVTLDRQLLNRVAT